MWPSLGRKGSAQEPCAPVRHEDNTSRLDGDAEDCVLDVFEPVGAPVPYGEPGRRTVYRQGVIVTTAPLPNTSVEAYRTPWAYSTAAGCDSGIVSTVVPPWTTAISSAKSSLT